MAKTTKKTTKAKKTGAKAKSTKAKTTAKARATAKPKKKGFLWGLLALKKQKQEERQAQPERSTNPIFRFRPHSRESFTKFAGPRRKVG